MLKTDHLPNFDSYLVTFQSYPTGSAGFIYFVCKIAGSGEGVMLFGQAIILASGLCVFGAFVKKSLTFSYGIILLASVYLLTINVPATDLCVDTLISLLALASFAVICFYRDDRKKAAALSFPIVAFLFLVKNSGGFFVLTHCFLLLLLELLDFLRSRKKRSARDLFIILLFSLFLPLFIYYLWNQHVAVSFYDGFTSSHSLSPTYLYNIFFSKNREDLLGILKAFLHRQFSPSLEIYAVIAWPCVYLVSALFRHFSGKPQPAAQWKFFLWSIFSYVCYLIGMLAMYLFSMPLEDALELASYARYLYTMTTYLIGISVIFLLREISSSGPGESCRAKAISLVLVLFLLLTTPAYLPNLFHGTNLSPEKALLMQAKSDHRIPDQSLCYVIANDDNGLIFLLSRYELWTPNVTVGPVPTPEEYADLIRQYEYLIILHDDPALAPFLDEYGLTPGQSVYHLYNYR